MKKQILSEQFKRMQELAGILNENEDPNNFTLKFVKDFETPLSYKHDGFGKIILRDVLDIVKAAGEQGLNINDLFKHDKFKDVTAMKSNILRWIDQVVEDGYLSKI